MDFGGGLRKGWSTINSDYQCPQLNRKVKILSALYFNRMGCGNTLYLGATPVKLMPRVLARIQGKGVMDASFYNGLNAVFQVMRGWNMPILFTSCIDSNLQRSELMRQNKVWELRRLHICEWCAFIVLGVLVMNGLKSGLGFMELFQSMYSREEI